MRTFSVWLNKKNFTHNYICRNRCRTICLTENVNNCRVISCILTRQQKVHQAVDARIIIVLVCMH